jgi:hypothetical protein
MLNHAAQTTIDSVGQLQFITSSLHSVGRPATCDQWHHNLVGQQTRENCSTEKRQKIPNLASSSKRSTSDTLHKRYEDHQVSSMSIKGPESSFHRRRNMKFSQISLLGSQDLSSLTVLLRYLFKGMSLYQEDDHQQLTTDPAISNYLHRDSVIQWGSIWVSSLQDGYCTRVPPRRRSSSPCLTGAFSGHGGATAPTTAGSGVATAAATERSRDPTDNRDTDLNTTAVEEAALGAERTASAHIFQRQFVPACHPCSNRASAFSPVVPYADSY